MNIEYQEANTFQELMDVEWEQDSYGYYWLRVKVKNHKASFYMEPRPNYCDRGHWQVMCEGFWDENNINSIDHADFFPRLYMSLASAKDEIQRFVAWRALKISLGSVELQRHNQKRSEGLTNGAHTIIEAYTDIEDSIVRKEALERYIEVAEPVEEITESGYYAIQNVSKGEKINRVVEVVYYGIDDYGSGRWGAYIVEKDGNLEPIKQYMDGWIDVKIANLDLFERSI